MSDQRGTCARPAAGKWQDPAYKYMDCHAFCIWRMLLTDWISAVQSDGHWEIIPGRAPSHLAFLERQA